MKRLTNLLMAPFAAAFGVAYAHPWLTIVLSGALALGFGLFHELVWMAVFLCVGAYMMMWLDESLHPAPVELGAGDNVE